MNEIIIPTREEILSLLGSSKKIPFSPNYVSVDQDLEELVTRENFDQSINYVLSPGVSVIDKNSNIVLVQRVPLSIAFLKKEDYRKSFLEQKLLRGDEKYIKKLYELGFLDKEYMPTINRVEAIRNLFPQRPFFNAFYLFPTDICNLNCYYCNVEHNMSRDYKKSFMNIEIAKKAVDLFIENLITNKELLNSYKPKYLAFYGGEALINGKILNECIAYASERFRNSGLVDKINICLMTNGTLIDDEQADFLGKHSVNITISFDGLVQHHDSMRVFHNGRGSFQQTLEGYRRIKNRCNTTILCTVGGHNIGDLEEISYFFRDELEPDAVEFALVRNLKYGSSPTRINYLEEAFEKLYVAYKILRKRGIPENNFSRRILAFANKSIYSYHLTRCGDILYVSPQGDLYVCDSYLGMGEKTRLSVSSNLQEIQDNHQVKEWFERHPFNMHECKECVPISLCGGGCPYNAQLIKESIYDKDVQNCKLNNFVFDKLIEELQRMKMGDLIGQV